jgi:hypothetical protein
MRHVAWVLSLAGIAAGCSGGSPVAGPSDAPPITGYVVAHTSVSMGVPGAPGGTVTVPAVELSTSPTSDVPVYRVTYDPTTIRSASGGALGQSDLVIGRRISVVTRFPLLMSKPIIVSGDTLTVLE